MKKLICLLMAVCLIATGAGCAQPGTLPAGTKPEDIKQGTAELPADLPLIGGEGEFPSGNPEDRPKPKPQEKPEPEEKPEPKPEEKPAPKPEEKPKPKPEEKPAPKPEEKPAPKPEEKPDPAPAPAPAPADEMRAVWVSYLELDGMLKGKSRSQFRDNFARACENAKDLGLNTIIAHVRPFGDAVYNSSLFPTSYLITGTEGDPLPFDPLTVMVETAHQTGLRLEAWINPYRVRANGNRALSAGNPAKKFLDEGSDAVYTYNSGVYYNPGSPEAVELIVEGVKEIVSNYNVDGIHFDDYFYATTDPSIDSGLYSQIGGGKSLGDWRRSNVNEMVRKVYSAIKTIKPAVRFGISPQGNTSINYGSLYADVATWVSKSGYVDYICPQIYYGFLHHTHDFNKIAREFSSMIKTDSVDLYVGLSVYKIGKEDAYAGASGRTEWIDHSDMLSRMVTAARGTPRCNGFMLYSYNSMFHPGTAVSGQVESELSALKKVL